MPLSRNFLFSFFLLLDTIELKHLIILCSTFSHFPLTVIPLQPHDLAMIFSFRKLHHDAIDSILGCCWFLSALNPFNEYQNWNFRSIDKKRCERMKSNWNWKKVNSNYFAFACFFFKKMFPIERNEMRKPSCMFCFCYKHIQYNRDCSFSFLFFSQSILVYFFLLLICVVLLDLIFFFNLVLFDFIIYCLLRYTILMSEILLTPNGLQWLALQRLQQV